MQSERNRHSQGRRVHSHIHRKPRIPSPIGDQQSPRWIAITPGTDLEITVHQKVVGESIDYFADRCEGITVKILADSADADDSWNGDVRPGSIGYLSGPDADLTAAEVKKLKKCLSDSDWDYKNNVEVAN